LLRVHPNATAGVKRSRTLEASMVVRGVLVSTQEQIDFECPDVRGILVLSFPLSPSLSLSLSLK